MSSPEIFKKQETDEEQMTRYRKEKELIDARFEYFLRARKDGMAEDVFQKEREANHERFRKLMESLNPHVAAQIAEEMSKKLEQDRLTR